MGSGILVCLFVCYPNESSTVLGCIERDYGTTIGIRKNGRPGVYRHCLRAPDARVLGQRLQT